MCKEIWIDIFEEFLTENDREPTDQEMQDAYSDHCADLIDCYDD
jgi:hypothetical protein